MKSPIILLLGMFAGTYLNNDKFRKQVDDGIKGGLGRVVDALNKAGDGYVPDMEPTEESDTGMAESDNECGDTDIDS